MLDFLPKEVKARVNMFAHDFNVEPAEFVECLLIDWWSKRAAELMEEDFSESPRSIMWTLDDQDNRKLIKGEDLFNVLVASYREELKAKRILREQELKKMGNILTENRNQ